MGAIPTRRENGFVEMAYYGDAAWHVTGNPLTFEETLDTDATAVKAGMDWKALRGIVQYYTERGQQGLQSFDEHHVIFRSDTKAPIGLVSDEFELFQPRQCLDFFRDILSVNGFRMNTAGTLFGGRRFWAMASIGEEACIMDKDAMRGYLLCATAVDGSLKTTFDFVAERVVCENTLNMALSSASPLRVAISHRSKIDVDEVKRKLGIVRGSFDQFINASKKLALTTCNIADAGDFTAKLLVDSKTVTKADVTTSTGYRTILNLFDHGKGNHGETLWDLVNGVTEYVDHVQRAKSDSHRMANSMFGRGDALKTLAFERAIALAD